MQLTSGSIFLNGRLSIGHYLLNNKHKTMRFLKIMGIFTSILSLLSCGHGNKRVTQNDGINSNIPVAARITIDKLPDVLRNVQQEILIMIL